jgi:cytoskeletal protein RodZ
MTIQKSINLALVAFVATLGVALMLVVISVSAQEGDIEEITPVTTQTEESTEEESSESDITEETTEESATTSNFDYVAQPGDSYSLMARKAVQTYGVINSVNLSGAQIIFVETNLTLAAGSPVLNLGQQVSIDGNLVSEWIEKAQALTEEQQAEWQPYVDRANFNTNSVGEATE